MRTVQEELETALETVLREPVKLTVAGRTDTGVHAEGQVASFVTAGEMPANLAQRLNGLGPRDIAVTAAMPAEDGFDARRDAISRTYRYRILARRSSSPFEQNRALWWPHKMDYEALEACAAALTGKHDFTAFTPTQTDHVHFNRNILTPPGPGTATSPPSTSPPTPSCATWSASSSAPCSKSPAAAEPWRASSSSYVEPPAPKQAKPLLLTACTWSPSRTTSAQRERLRLGGAGIPPNWRILKIDALISASICQGGRCPAPPSPKPALDRPSQSSPTCLGPNLTIRV